MTGRPPDFPRYERIRLGLQVCAADDGCPRAPSKGTRGYCRRHWKALSHRPRSLGPDAVRTHIALPAALVAKLTDVAASERISASEWIRRAVAEKLGQGGSTS